MPEIQAKPSRIGTREAKEARIMDATRLSAPFPPDRVSWRVGSTTGDKTKGMALAYIDARDVMGRLDDVCGPGGWQCRYLAVGTKTSCEIGVKIESEWVWKADGAGDTDFEGDKGAFSDAFKRAAVKWGIGRYLYDVDAPWVQIEPMGKSFKIKDSEHPRLRAILTGSAPKQAAAEPAYAAWVKQARGEIANLNTATACNEWVIKHTRTLDKLKTQSEEAYNGLMKEITERQTRLLAA